MPGYKEIIQNKLGYYALVVRKYNIGDKVYFFSKFPDIDNSVLEIAWSYAVKKIQNTEIIKDAASLSEEAAIIIKIKVDNIGYNSDSIYQYLNSGFDVKKLKLADENIERRVRNIIAVRYLQNLSVEIFQLQNKSKNSFKAKAARFGNKFKYGIFIILVIGAFSAPRIITGLTPVDKLTDRIHRASGHKIRVGAICRDGWRSSATGRGACSHHGGVSEWIYAISYYKTVEECKKEAQEKSWRK
jgi:hypothetical protein